MARVPKLLEDHIGSKSMKLWVLANKLVYHFEFDTQYLLTSSFIRVQEFYESSFPNIRGKIFDIEDYMDAYAREYGKFDYFDRILGFNIPGFIVSEFAEVYEGHMREKERFLFRFLKEPVDMYIKDKHEFYVIGTIAGDNSTLNHELAHAMWGCDEAYQEEMTELLDKYARSLKKIEKGLEEDSYAPEVWEDEKQAYLATTTKRELMRRGWVSESFKHLEEFRVVFRRHKKELLKNATCNQDIQGPTH